MNKCILPFSHLYHFTNGNTYPCPKLTNNKNYILGKNTESVESLFNSEILKEMRRDFKNDAFPKVCYEQCFNSLSPTNQCVRTNNINDILNLETITEVDGKLNPIHYTIKNIPESNLCNLKCVYCGENNSSKHNNNIVKFSFDDSGFEEKFLFNIENMQECWFSSGESFLQPKYFWALMELKNRNLYHVKISVITNGTILNQKTKLFLQLLNQFKNPHILFSIDSTNSRFEIIRKDALWEVVLNNLKFIKNNYGNIKCVFQPVISILNILHIKQLHEFLINENLLDIVGDIRLYHLTGPDFLNIKNIRNKKFIRNYFDEYINFLNLKNTKYDYFFNSKSVVDRINEIYNFIDSSKSNDESIKNLEDFLKTLQNTEINQEINILMEES